MLDSNPFAISIWVFLSPWKTHEETYEDSSHPRVIISTRSEDDRGCESGVFGDGLAAGFVLYAQPHFDDNGVGGDEEAKKYGIVLEYAKTGNEVCRTLVGFNNNDLLVEEGQWHHIAFFATPIAKEGYERISLYINGDLAERKAQESRRLHSRPESKTTIGRYTTHGGSSSISNFDLDGRIGMLSFWETGGPPLYSTISKRTKIQSVSDEDHVVRAIMRAAFDIVAIQELSLEGLFVREPTLLYTFDGHQAKKVTHKLNSKSRLVNEVMSGRNGTIMTDHVEMTSFKVAA
mmetsp:Transcript_2430/g.5604  ORF Transcript_2430/g.5604 Transcript_2430/m.5604 type:complete len:290 (-) Transcript_2430:44-913(-)